MDEIVGILLLCLLILGIPAVVIIFFINQVKHLIIKEIAMLSTRIDQLRSALDDLKKEPAIVTVEKLKAEEQKEESDTKEEEPVQTSTPFQDRWMRHPVQTEEEWREVKPAGPIELNPAQETVEPEETRQEEAVVFFQTPDKEFSESPQDRPEPTPVPRKKKAPAKKDYENLFGVNLLSKIGIATLVLGIAYFVKYAIDQNWINEIGRVAVGVLSGAALIGIAHRLQNNFRTFSSILIGGGISVLYITIALAFWEYQLFSQPVAFVLLILITVLSVFLSLVYDKKELAVFSLLGGFASPLMLTSGTGNYIVLFSYLLLLNTGMLIIAYRKEWKIVSMIAYLLTQGFYWAWLFRSFEDQYLGAVSFGFLFFAQFYILALIAYFRSGRKIAPFQTFIILGNNLSLFCAAFYIFHDYPVDLRGVITIVIALLNAMPLWIVYKDKNFNSNMLYLLIAIVLSFVSLAIPVQLDGCVITMFWAAETIILLFLYRNSSIRVFKVAYLLLQALVLIALAMDWDKQYGTYHMDHLRVILNEPFITSLVVILSLFANLWLNKALKLEFALAGYRIRLQTALKMTITFVIFLSLYFELRYQIPFYAGTVFSDLVLSSYTYLFIAVYAVLKWKKVKWMQSLYALIVLATLSYASYYMYCVLNVRKEVLLETLPGWGYYALHYVSIPALIVFFIFLIKKAGVMSNQRFNLNRAYWFVAIVSVIVLSHETDGLALMLFGGSSFGEQDLVLQYSHTIAYPILWGIVSFVLMVLGMKYGNRNLRLISLSLLAFIIAKLYLYDIWGMNQTGRIIAFIFLGLLFLLVSFLYQKLKILFQKKEEDKTDE